MNVKGKSKAKGLLYDDQNLIYMNLRRTHFCTMT